MEDEDTAPAHSGEVPKGDKISARYRETAQVYTHKEKAKAWSDAGEMVKTYSDELIKRWKEEIDTYLVFAGLFSAVLTTFNVQSYLLLQISPPDPSIALLQQISSQLNGFSIAYPFVNSTHSPDTSATSTSASPPRRGWAVWLNGLWFSGLILSLTSAFIVILVKQWLNEYSSGLYGGSLPVARVRQYRLDSLRTWHVEEIVGIIPVLLLLALACFLAGLLVLLRNLHHTVAAISSALVGLLVLFTVVTTILPLFYHRCSYLLPQIRQLNSAWQSRRFIFWLCKRAPGAILSFPRKLSSGFRSVCTPLKRWRSFLWYAITVTMGMCKNADLPESWSDRKQTWLGRERSAIRSERREWEKQVLLEAYRSTLHADALSSAAVCLMDFDSVDVLDYFRRLHKSVRNHFGPVANSENGPLGWGNQQQLLWLQVILCRLFDEDAPPLSEEESSALSTYFKCGVWSPSMAIRDTAWAMTTLDSIRDYLEPDDRSKLQFPDERRLRTERQKLMREAIQHSEALPDAQDENAGLPYKAPLERVWVSAATQAYDEVCAKQSRLARASPDDATVTRTKYIESVDWFLQCANLALTPSLPSDDLETVREYKEEVLNKLTRDLLRMLAKEELPPIPDGLVPEVLDIAWTLVTDKNAAQDFAFSSGGDRWSCEHVQDIAGKLISKIQVRLGIGEDSDTVSTSVQPMTDNAEVYFSASASSASLSGGAAEGDRDPGRASDGNHNSAQEQRAGNGSAY